MKIPTGPSGFPTVSPSQLRVYGAGGFELEEQEEDRGCPRQYKARYVDRSVPETFSEILAYGSLIHDCLYRMERDSIGPEEALERCFPPHLDPKYWREAMDDLDQYLLRGGPGNLYMTLDVEQELDAELYVDEDFGPIHIRGIVDHLAVDPDDDGLIHLTDYKTNRRPATVEQVRGDSQLKAYHFLVMKNWARYSATGFPRIVTHLDLVKWNDVAVRYSPSDIEAWRSWAIAVVRKILRDEQALPMLNPGCGHCPVKDDCPVFQQLPQLGLELVDGVPEDADALALWMTEANKVRLLLEKSIKEIRERFEGEALRHGEVTAGGTRWFREPNWVNQVDMRVLHRAMGDDFYEVAKASKTAIEKYTKDWDTHAKIAVGQALSRVPSGDKVSTEKAGGNDE